MVALLPAAGAFIYYHLPVASTTGYVSRWAGLCNGTVGLFTLSDRARNKSPGTSDLRRSDDFTPCLHGRCPEGSVRSCQGEMALDVESILCCCMHCEESLRESHALEPLHLMRTLRSIVAASTAFMAFYDSKFAGSRWTKPYFFCNLRMSVRAARLFVLVLTSASRTSPSASTARHR